MKREMNLSGLLESSKVIVDGLFLLRIQKEDKELLEALRREAQYANKTTQALYDSVQHIKKENKPEVAQ